MYGTLMAGDEHFFAFIRGACSHLPADKVTTAIAAGFLIAKLFEQRAKSITSFMI